MSYPSSWDSSYYANDRVRLRVKTKKTADPFDYIQKTVISRADNLSGLHSSKDFLSYRCRAYRFTEPYKDNE